MEELDKGLFVSLSEKNGMKKMHISAMQAETKIKYF